MKQANFSSEDLAKAMANVSVTVCPSAANLETLKQLKKDSRESRSMEKSQSFYDVQAEIRAGFLLFLIK